MTGDIGMTLEQLAHELEFGDRTEGVDIDAILAAAAACRQLSVITAHTDLPKCEHCAEFAAETQRRLARVPHSANHRSLAHWLTDCDVANCPPAIERKLFHIAEQCGKRQCFNAMNSASELTKLIMALLREILNPNVPQVIGGEIDAKAEIERVRAIREFSAVPEIPTQFDTRDVGDFLT